MKTLIAYYSRAGATKKAAEGLQKITNGELFEIRGEKIMGIISQHSEFPERNTECYERYICQSGKYMKWRTVEKECGERQGC